MQARAMASSEPLRTSNNQMSLRWRERSRTSGCTSGRTTSTRTHTRNRCTCLLGGHVSDSESTTRKCLSCRTCLCYWTQPKLRPNRTHQQQQQQQPHKTIPLKTTLVEHRTHTTTTKRTKMRTKNQEKLRIIINPTQFTNCIRYYCSTTRVVMYLLMFLLVILGASVATFGPTSASATQLASAKHKTLPQTTHNKNLLDQQSDEQESSSLNQANAQNREITANENELTATQNYYPHSSTNKRQHSHHRHRMNYFIHQQNNNAINPHRNKHSNLAHLSQQPKLAAEEEQFASSAAAAAAAAAASNYGQQTNNERNFDNLIPYQQRATFVEDRKKKSAADNDKWSRIHSLKHALNLHNYAHRKQVELNKISASPSSLLDLAASHSGSTDIDLNNDEEIANEVEDNGIPRPKSTSGSETTHDEIDFENNKAEATSQQEVPERLPIVVSYSDNSYVSASPIIDANGAKIGRLRTKSTNSRTSTESIASSGESSNELSKEIRRVSDLDTVATASTLTTTTEATTTIPTTATTTTTLLSYLRGSLDENSDVSKSKSESSFDRFSKQARLWSDFSDGLDFDLSDDEDDKDDISMEDGKLGGSLVEKIDFDSSQGILDSTPSETSSIRTDQFRDEPTAKNELIGSRIKFDINEQYLNRPGTIIKTRESIEKGATFIKYTIVTNLNACLVECWITDSCDTAVYQESPVDFSSTNNSNSNNNNIINSSHHINSAQSTTQMTSPVMMLLDNAPGRTSSATLSMQQNDIYQVTLPSIYGSSTPSSILYQTTNKNYAIESDNNHIHTTDTKTIINKSDYSSSNDSLIGDGDYENSGDRYNTRRPRKSVYEANNAADNYVKGMRNEIKHNVRWFKNSKNYQPHDQQQQQEQQHKLLLQQRRFKNLGENGFYICYLFECAKESGYKCDFSPHNFYTSSTKQQAFSDNKYSSLIRSPTNYLPANGREITLSSQSKWTRIHRASIDINEEDISRIEQGGLNSAIIAIMFGVGATGMLIFIVGHKMKSIRRRVAYEGRRRSIVPDKDFLINTLAD